MQPEFWRDRWRTGQIGFHQSKVERYLEKYWPALGLANTPGLVNSNRVFVPLCGKTLDLTWLVDRGHAVAGVELSGAALESYCMENGILARRRSGDGFEVYEAPNLRLYCGDFFELDPERLGPVSAVYDRAALISWNSDLRAAYVAHMRKLTNSGTQTLLITMEYPQSQMSGPPFSVSADDIERLYGRDHTIRELARQDVLANEARLRARGVKELHEVCYHLTRR